MMNSTHNTAHNARFANEYTPHTPPRAAAQHLPVTLMLPIDTLSFLQALCVCP
jgi:hypothetical protein